MSGKDLEARIDVRADRLRDAEDDPSDQRSPERTEPPITTASNAKSRRLAPVLGPNEETIPNARPARATVANAIDAAIPKTCR